MNNIVVEETVFFKKIKFNQILRKNDQNEFENI